jgi:hypothetical protein
MPARFTKTNTTNHTFSVFFAENQRPMIFQKEPHTATGTINKSKRELSKGNKVLFTSYR